MENRASHFVSFIFAAAAVLLGAGSSQATGFTVHSYELGERIALTNGTRVWTAQLDVSVDGLVSHVPSFCVDVFAPIGIGEYDARDVLDADTAVAPLGERSRNFAWAGHVMETFGADVANLVTAGITRVQAITGVQSAIWEGIYGGGMVNRNSLTAGARSVYDRILRTGGDGATNALIVELRGNQDQVIVGANPVPEPSAALVFGLGSLVAGSVVGRRAA